MFTVVPVKPKGYNNENQCTNTLLNNSDERRYSQHGGTTWGTVHATLTRWSMVHIMPLMHNSMFAKST